MKRRLCLILSMVMVVFLLAGCGKRTNITSTFDGELSSASVLRTLIEFKASEDNAGITITPLKVEVKTTNSFKGQAAIVFSKAYDATTLDAMITSIYESDKRDANLKAVAKLYKEVKSQFKSTTNALPDKVYQFVQPESEAFLAEVEAYIDSVASSQASMTQINEAADAFSAKVTEIVSKLTEIKGDYLAEYADLESTIADIDAVKNVAIQAVSSKQVKLKESMTKSAQNTMQSKVIKELESYTKASLKGVSGVKYDDVKYNDTEIYALIKFDDITDVYPHIAVGTSNTLLEMENATATLIRDLAKAELKYSIDYMNPASLKAVKDLYNEINEQINQLRLIKLGSQGILITDRYKAAFTVILREYAAASKELYTKYAGELDALAIDEITAKTESIVADAIAELQELGASYTERIETEVTKLQEELEAYAVAETNTNNDADEVDKTVEVIEGFFYDRLEKYTDNAPTYEDAIDKFEGITLVYLLFDQTGFYNYAEGKYAEFRLTIDGNYINKKTYNDKIDSADNFHVNAQDSGDTTVRVIGDSSEAMALMELNTFSISYYKYILYAVIIILIALAVIGRIFRKIRHITKKITTVFFLLLLAAIIIYPMAWVIGSSFSTSQSLASVGISPIPKNPSLIQYRRLFLSDEYEFLKWYKNSFKIAVFNTIAAVLLTVSTAYVFSRFKFKGKKAGMMFMLVIQIFPTFSSMVAIYTLLASIKVFKPLTGKDTLVDTHLGLLLVYVSGQIPYNTWLVKGYFDTIPRTLDEAAKIDGASNLQAFWKIILPLGIPIVSFVAVTSFMSPWMDYILPSMLLKSNANKTVAVGLYSLINGKENNNFTMFAAGAVLVAVPITAIYAFCQKYIVTGLSSGAVKG